MSNQIDLNDLEDLKPLKNQDLDTVSVDSSNIKVPKYYNFFTLKLKEKYAFYSDPVNLPTLNSDQIKILNKLIALNKSLDFNDTNPEIKKLRFFSLGEYFDSLSIWLQISAIETTNTIQSNLTEVLNALKTKNKIIGFFSHSSKNVNQNLNITQNLTTDEINTLRKSRGLNLKEDQQQVQNVTFNEDVGLITSIINSPNNAHGKTLYLTLDKQKVFPFRIEKNSPIKITFDPTKNDGEFVIGMSDSIFYESQEEELDIVIDHNFGTRNLNIQVFNIVSNEVDLKYPTYPNIEYPSDNQIKIYLSEPRRVHVVISK